MCRHQWDEVRRAFSPAPRNIEVERATGEVLRQMAFGVTTVELRCRKCGDVEAKLLVGDVRS